MRSGLVLLTLVVAACQSGKAKPRDERLPPPSIVSNPVLESELAVVRFTPDAVRRLDLQTSQVSALDVAEARLTGGEVIVPPGHAVTVTAPVGGELRPSSPDASRLLPGAAVKRNEVLLRLVPFAPVDRDVSARAQREVAASAAQLRAADARVQRLSQMGSDRAVSQRAYEEAVAARDILQADVAAAEARARTMRTTPLLADVMMFVRAPVDGVIRNLSAAPGQAVASGTALLEIVAVDALQIRASVYAGDLASIDATQSARVQPLSARGDPAAEPLIATPVEGPPTAAPDRATVDRYFGLPTGSSLLPGERVLLELPLRASKRALTVPRAALLYDALGSGWVYACAGENAFRRMRIDPLRVVDERVVYERGPALGTCIASVGAAEIFGSEFEPGH